MLSFFTRLPSPAVSLAVSSPITRDSFRPQSQLEEHTSYIYKAKPSVVPSSESTTKLLSQDGKRKKKGLQKYNRHGLSEQAVQGREAARVARRLKVQAIATTTTAPELPLPRHTNRQVIDIRTERQRQTDRKADDRRNKTPGAHR
jgi:hypothetical protein